MNEKALALIGLIAPLIGLVSVAVSIMLSPWFRWDSNALSDLGHSLNSSVASIFNGGLLLAGFLLAIYSVSALYKYARLTSLFLTLCALLLQSIAVFDEVYGRLHFFVSVAFFLSLAPASLSYAFERRSLLAVLGLVVALAAWLVHYLGLLDLGIAVPETISTLAIVPWVLSSAVDIYLERQESSINWI
ncbi:MAG: DUF998 domain-containing protein [Candidatus Bathyarchaeia archaeon]